MATHLKNTVTTIFHCAVRFVLTFKNMTFNWTIYSSGNLTIGASSILAVCSCRLSFTNYAPAPHFCYPPIGYIYPDVYDLLISHCMCGLWPRFCKSSHIVRRSRWGGNGTYRSPDARPRCWKMVSQMLGTWQYLDTIFGSESTNECEGAQAGEGSSLFDMWSMCLENGYIISYVYSFLVSLTIHRLSRSSLSMAW